MRKGVRMQLKIQATPEKVFTALTESGAVTQWFAESADISLDEKRYAFWGRFTPEAPNQEQGQHRILKLEPNRQLQYQWQLQGVETIVDFKLLPRDNMTILTLIHRGDSGIGSHMPDSYNMEDFWFLMLENLRRYVDGKPSEARLDFTQPMTGDVTQSIEVDASAEEVFKVLINPEQLEQWIAHKARVDPKVGGDFDLGWKGVPAFKIIEFEANQKLAYEWPEGDGKGGLMETIVTWTLEDSGGKTRLTIVQSGFAADANTGGLKAGWLNFINWARSVVEYGASWQPPVLELIKEMETYYPAAISKAQAELSFE